MRVLLDTHIFLWLIAGDSRLPHDVEGAVRDPANEVYLSPVSLWEAVVKHALGKLPVPYPPARYLVDQRRRHSINSLPLDENSFERLADLPPLHRDPSTGCSSARPWSTTSSWRRSMRRSAPTR